MSDYNIRYEILNYNKFRNRIKSIISNKNNKFQVVEHSNLGKTSCGFDIEHYSIGKGPLHIIYMGGTHGNEIITVDYVTQLMENIALGNGVYKEFEQDLFTIDFIPIQNPEGFFTTTYALDSILKNKTEVEIEKFCNDYWKAYKIDDYNVISINKILKQFCTMFSLEQEYIFIEKNFWNIYRNNSISLEELVSYLKYISGVDISKIYIFIKKFWNEFFINLDIVNFQKKHLSLFDNVSIDCIPEIDLAHKNLIEKLKKIYNKNNFPNATLANFFANADGVNLNDNNPFYYNEFKKRLLNENVIYAKLRDNNIIKSLPGPIGLPSKDLNRPFEFCVENKVILDLLKKLEDKKENYIFVNCHGTGGLFFLYPFFDILNEKDNGVKIRNFNFYINNRLSTEYTKTIGNVYEKYTGENLKYETMGHPDKIVGFGDYLRSKYIGSFLLELSKMGGNPIAPYGDKNGNYFLTIVANLEANMSMINALKEISYLYDMNYEISYDNKGIVKYNKK